MTVSSSDLSHAQSEFIQHPDIRTISTLFLGWTFWLAIEYTFIHIWIDLVPMSLRNSSRSFWGRVPVSTDIEEKSHVQPQGQSPTSAHSNGHSLAGHTCKVLLLLLNLSVAAAAIGTFVSLLTFNESTAAGSCAFAIAWSGLAGQGIRCLGFAKLVSDLRRLHIGKTEHTCLWLVIIASMASTFVIEGVGGGFTNDVPQIPGLVLCYKSHPLVPASVNGALNIVMELYVLTRMYILIVPEFLRAKHRREALRDQRLASGLSLLVLDILTVIPSIVCIDLAADVIPFSLGAVSVLFAFNYRPPGESTNQGRAVSPIISSASVNGLSIVDGDVSRDGGVLARVDPASRSYRSSSSRSAIPGDGGYGFESNVNLRNGLRAMRLKATNPDLPSRPESSIFSDDSRSEVESKFDNDGILVLGPGDEDAIPTPDPDEIERGFASDSAARPANRRSMTDLPRLIIPNDVARPIHAQRVSIPSHRQPSLDPITGGRPVRLLPRLGAQQMLTMPIGPVDLSRSAPTGPRPLPRLQLVAPHRQRDISQPSFLPLGVSSAPPTQAFHQLTRMVVSPGGQEPPETAFSPIASSAGYPVSRAGSSSVGQNTPSTGRSTSPRPPSRYKYISARSDFPARSSTTPETSVQSPPTAVIPPPRGESVPKQWKSSLKSNASRIEEGLAFSPPPSEYQFEGDTGVRQLSRTSSITSSEARQRSLYALNFARSPSARSRATTIDTPSIAEEFNGFDMEPMDTSLYYSPQRRPSARRPPEPPSQPYSRRASTVRTSAGPPPTASSVGTFEIVRIPYDQPVPTFPRRLPEVGFNRDERLKIGAGMPGSEV